MAQMKNLQIASNVGKTMYSHLLNTEKIKGIDTGKFTVLVAFDEKETKRIKKMLSKEYKKYCEENEKKYKSDFFMPIKDINGQEYFKFKLNHEGQTKKGEKYQRTVVFFDAQGNPLDLKQELGNGSKISICFNATPFEGFGGGMTLYINAIQVIKRVDSSRTMESYGFKKYQVEEDEEEIETEEGEEVVEDIEEDDEGDF